MSQYTNFVEPLQDYFTPEELAAFSPSIIEAATIDGNLQLIPRHADISALHYRTDLFGDADLQAKFEEAYGYPLAPPTTLDQMYDMAEFFVGEGVVKYGTAVRRQGRGPRGPLLRAPLRQRRRLLRRRPQPHLRLRGRRRVGEVDAGPLRQRARSRPTPPTSSGTSVAANFCNGDVAFYLEWYGWYGYFQDPESCPNVAGKFGLARGPVGRRRRAHRLGRRTRLLA